MEGKQIEGTMEGIQMNDGRKEAGGIGGRREDGWIDGRREDG